MLPERLVEELILVADVTGVPGDRRHVLSTTFAAAPAWAIPALAQARLICREAAEDAFPAHALSLVAECTVLHCWLPGSCIAAHVDDGPGEYLKNRLISCVVWLNEGFEGGDFEVHASGRTDTIHVIDRQN